MHVVDHHRRGIHRVGGWSHSVGRCVRSLDLEAPQVWFWVLTRATHQRQTGQEQNILLIRHAMKLANFHTDGIDAIQGNTKVRVYCTIVNCIL